MGAIIENGTVKTVFPSAEKARERTREKQAKLEEEKAVERQKQREEKEAEREKQLEPLRKTCMAAIQEASDRGAFEAEIMLDPTTVGRGLALGEVLRELRRAGYVVNTRPKTVDHGDSAAPALVDYTELTITWGL